MLEQKVFKIPLIPGLQWIKMSGRKRLREKDLFFSHKNEVVKRRLEFHFKKFLTELRNFPFH